MLTDPRWGIVQKQACHGSKETIFFFKKKCALCAYVVNWIVKGTPELTFEPFFVYFRFG